MNTPLNHQQVKDIKPGAENAYVHPYPNRQYRRALKNSKATYGSVENANNRKETPGREISKQRFPNKKVELDETGKPKLDINGKKRLTFTGFLKTILHRRPKPIYPI